MTHKQLWIDIEVVEVVGIFKVIWNRRDIISETTYHNLFQLEVVWLIQ